MRELDYQPNSAARTLVTRRSNTLGIVTVDSTLFGPASMVYGIEQAARAAGYFVSIASISTLTRRSVLEAVHRLREQGVEGIVAIVPKDSGVAALADVPAGIAWSGSASGGTADVPMVGVDNTVGAALVTQHLLGAGTPHRAPHLRPVGLAGGPRAARRVAADPAGGGGARARSAGRRLERAVGLRDRANGWPRTGPSRRSSARTTRWPWASCGHCPKWAAGFPTR